MAQILVPFDHSENASVALQQALLIAQKSAAKVEVFHVINLLVSRDYPMTWTESDEQEIRESLQSKVEIAKRLSSVHDVEVSVTLQRGERVVDEVLLRATNSDTIFIMMGTHGVTGLIDKVLGTNSLDVISASKWPVLLIPSHWEAREINELIVASELNELISITDSVKDLEAFFKIPARAIQLSGVIDTVEQTTSEVDGIPFEYVSSNIEHSLAQNLRTYTKDYPNAILVMHIHPRKFLQKFFGVSLTEETAKVIEIPLLSVRRDTTA